MPARVTQPAGSPAGRARVQVAVPGAPVDADSLEVCISGMLDTVERHLDPRLADDAWTTAFAWFRPTSVRREPDGLAFDLEPAVTWHLRPHTPYVLRLRDATGWRREERLTWIAIRLPSQAPQGYVPPPDPARRPSPASATPAARPAAESSAVREREAVVAAETERRRAEDLRLDQERRRAEAERQEVERREAERREAERREAERVGRGPEETGRQPGRRGARLPILSALVLTLLVAAGLGAWFYRGALFGDEAGSQASAAPAVPTTLEGARKFLAGNPGADESYGLADRFMKDKQLDGAFLLLRNAASKGNAAAALALGEMYDPETWSAETSPLPAPNLSQAVEWYGQAAAAGLAEAQYRYGMLLLSGKTTVPNGPELGVAMLRKAADQGLEKAREALPK